MRINRFLFCLTVNTLLITNAVFPQAGTGNFDETWREFLENDKISNMSALGKPNRAYEPLDYAKYLLMNTNTNFCQSEVELAEDLMAEIQEMDTRIPQAIPGYVGKMEELVSRVEAYHFMDRIWQQFLETREVSIDELEAIEAAKTSCEKQTLAKYSFMTAYYHFCAGDIETSKDIFQNRTLRLAEKTSLRVNDVPGLAQEVARMKKLYQDMARLDQAWDSYVATNVSPGWDNELPLYPCNPIPKMKELVLKGAVDLCNAGPEALAEVKKLWAGSTVEPDTEVKLKIQALEAAIARNEAKVTALNVAWEDFIIDNTVRYMGQYGYDYCTKEPLIRAYIMDGFAYVCEMGADMLQRIDELQRSDLTPLEPITMMKINELANLTEEYQANGRQIEAIWDRFVAQGDVLYEDYQSDEKYCDNIHQVKDWTMKGLSGTCEEGIAYLQQIDDFQRNFEFDFFEELECRVQRLRLKIWECRHEGLLKLAKIEAPEAPEARLQELMDEYGMGPRPDACNWE
ncbi:MAG: hypothetical protein AAFO03_01515 [Bacteroidota bacterium]